MSHQGWNPAPQKLLTPEEIKEKVPIIDLEKGNVNKVFNQYKNYNMNLIH